VVRDCKRRGEVVPAEFYCSLEDCVPEKGISWRANCLFFAEAVFKIRRTPQETVFLALAVFYSRRAPPGRNCSAEDPPPRGNLGLKLTRMDAIFKNLSLKSILN
jgi:hypothetical protein